MTNSSDLSADRRTRWKAVTSSPTLVGSACGRTALSAWRSAGGYADAAVGHRVGGLGHGVSPSVVMVVTADAGWSRSRRVERAAGGLHARGPRDALLEGAAPVVVQWGVVAAEAGQAERGQGHGVRDVVAAGARARHVEQPAVPGHDAGGPRTW